jgi:uncharacterized protein YggE
MEVHVRGPETLRTRRTRARRARPSRAAVGRAQGALLATLFLACAGTVSAQEEPAVPLIRVTGEATLSVEPDEVWIDVGVVTEAEQAEAATRRNAEKLDAALAALRRVLETDPPPGASTRIQTRGYSLRPIYRRPEKTGEREIAGFEATNVLRVRTTRLDRVGAVIDTAVREGGNRIEQLRFGLRDDREVRADALREAAVQARAKAETIAAALDLRIQRIRLVEEQQHGITPVRLRAETMAMAESAPTPIEAGTIEVRASVLLAAEIGR